MASPKTQIRNFFPKLSPTQFKITSDCDAFYNCIGHAAEDDRYWWPVNEPAYYWPPGLPFEITLQNFIAAFALLGYEPCDSFQLEEGFEKVAIYVDAQGLPTHMARQLEDGTWTSKLGKIWDIKHRTLGGLSGPSPAYGDPKQAIRRPKKPAA